MNSVCNRVLSSAVNWRPATPGSNTAQTCRRCAHKACNDGTGLDGLQQAIHALHGLPQGSTHPGRRCASASLPLSMPADNPGGSD